MTLCLLPLAGCTEKILHSDEPDKMKVWVTIQPLKFFIDEVSGGGVDVFVLVSPEENPEKHVTERAELERIALADLIFGIGLPFERSLFATMKAKMNWVGVIDIKGIADYDPDHVHTDQCLHSDEDRYVWLNPQHMAHCTTIVYQGLSSDDPRRTLEFRDRAHALIDRLEAFDSSLEEQMAPYAGRAFYIDHPTLGHFAHRYGLRQASIERAEGVSPNGAAKNWLRRAKADGAKAVIGQTQYGDRDLKALAEEAGLEVIMIDVMTENYFESLQHIADSLERSFTL